MLVTRTLMIAREGLDYDCDLGLRLRDTHEKRRSLDRPLSSGTRFGQEQRRYGRFVFPGKPTSVRFESEVDTATLNTALGILYVSSKYRQNGATHLQSLLRSYSKCS